MIYVKKLPYYPSELLQLALDDIAIINKDKRYRINAYVLHDYDEESKTCEVCLAGAVLANTIGVWREHEIPELLEEMEGDYIAYGNAKKLEVILDLESLNIYLMYLDYIKFIGQKLTKAEVMLIKNHEQKILKKLKKFSDCEHDIFIFTDFQLSHDFYSSIVEDIAYLDEKILGMRGR